MHDCLFEQALGDIAASDACCITPYCVYDLESVPCTEPGLQRCWARGPPEFRGVDLVLPVARLVTMTPYRHDCGLLSTTVEHAGSATKAF